MKVRLFILLLSLVCVSTVLYAQPTKVRGKITDAITKEPIPFATILFKGTTIGTTSDFDGNYFLETRNEVDTVLVNVMGYKNQTKSVKKHAFKTINFALVEDIAMLDEVVIIPGENPAHRIVRGIIANKKQNNPLKMHSYEADNYTKIELSLTNINEKFKKKRILKNFQFIFNYVDTSVVTGKAYLPFLISETLSKVYRSNKPKFSREVVKATKISGLENKNASIAQFTGRLSQEVNIYDNYIDLFGQGFVSPTNNSALLFYKYYLIDSAQYKGHYAYHLTFKPKSPRDATFVGDFWVTADEFAILDVKMRVSNKVNVNWINDILIEEEFKKRKNNIWFWDKQKMLVDFSFSEQDSTRQKGFLGKRTVHYSNVVFNEPFKKEFSAADSEVMITDEALDKSEVFWDKNRPYELSQSEKNIYKMVDSIKNVPLYRTIEDVIKTIVTGYYRLPNKKIEIGPYFKTLSFNDIEGKRLQLGFRTTSKWNDRIHFFGHLAYGTKDKEWKYKGGFLFKLRSKNDLWEAIGGHYRHDMEQLGKSTSRFFASGNILSSLLAKGSADKLSVVNELVTHYEREWFEDFSNKLTFRYREILPSIYVPFTPVGSKLPNIGEKITTKELMLNTRWSPGEKTIRRTFKRGQLKTKHPTFNLDLAWVTGKYAYQRIDLSIEHTQPIYPIGHTRFFGMTGKIFGTVPYPLLRLHEGNETYVYDPHAFNMMNYYEFASDTYASLSIQHHFMGFFLNKIPLLNRIKARTVVSGRVLWGTLSDNNNPNIANSKAPLLFPEGLGELKTPYFEAGVGVENIFKLIRVDAIWRLSHLHDRKNISKFGVRATLQLAF